MKIANRFRANRSWSIADQAIINQFISNPEHTFLVSFPRTGSHWLRMIMELYFGRPSLVRIFYYPDRTDFLTYHTHDLDLSVTCSRVIYLYRDPIDTIFSQLQYHNENSEDSERIIYWSDLYGKHLDKWLARETFTTQKTVITYEGMRYDLASTFAIITRHFNEPLNKQRLQWVAGRVTKDEVRRKVKHDPHVISLGEAYGASRETFRERQAELVWETVTREREHLLPYLKPFGGT